MREWFGRYLEDCPVIAAIKDDSGLEECIKNDIVLVFILYGNVCNIAEIVKKVKEAGCIAMVHIDLVEGLMGKDVSVDFIRNCTLADGIITTKQVLVKRAKSLGLYTILRFFVIDSMALVNIEKQCMSVQPDAIEILPGIMPKIVKKVKSISKVPVIAGGLVSEKEDVIGALSNGAMAVSTTSQSVWKM